MPVSRRSLKLAVGFSLMTAPFALSLCWIPYPVPRMEGLLFIAMTGVGLWMLLKTMRPLGETNERKIPGESGMVIALTALALLVRLPVLSQIPPGLWLDEAHHGLDAFTVLKSGHWPVFFSANTGREPLFIWMVTGCMRFFGATPEALRMPAALSGSLLVPLVYMTAKRIAGSEPALAAAALMTVSRWNLTFSRIGFRGILVPVFECLAVYALYSLKNKNAKRYASMAGIALGLGLYTGIPFRIFPLIFFFIWLWLYPDFERKGRLRNLFLMSAVGACTAFPMIWYFFRNPVAFTGRMSDTSVFKSGVLPGVITAVKQYGSCLLMCHYRGDGIVRHNMPAWPLADPFTGTLIIIGIVVGVRHFKRFAPIFLWWAGALIPAALGITWTGPHALRSIGALPAVMICAGVGLIHLIRCSGNKKNKARWMILILACSAAWNLSVYFGPQYETALHADPQTDAVRGFNVRETKLAAELVRIAGTGDTMIYLSPQLFFHPTLQFLAHDRCRLHLIESPDFFTKKELQGKDITCVIDTEPRNMFWLRNTPSKRFFDWWIETYHPVPGSFEEAIARCYIPRTGLNNTADNLIRDALKKTYPKSRVTSFSGFEIMHIAGRSPLLRQSDTK